MTSTVLQKNLLIDRTFLRVLISKGGLGARRKKSCDELSFQPRIELEIYSTNDVRANHSAFNNRNVLIFKIINLEDRDDLWRL